MAAASGAAERWSRNHWLALAGIVVLGSVVRLLLLPTEGLRGDLDQFVGWVHHIATRGLGTLYGVTDAGPVTFGPVMAYIWAVLAGIQPTFAVATDASDPAIRMLMKMPATVADYGLVGLVVWAFRHRPRWAVIAAAGIFLHPAVFYVSSWWGQYESIFALSGLAATLAAINGRNGMAAALVAISLMTKPQAIPFVVPFAAWFWSSGYARTRARGALIEVTRCALVGLVVIVALWIPFLPNGPIGYLGNLGTYQNEIFNVLSLRAWNPWWLLQVFAAGADFAVDDTPIVGALTLRHVGYAATASLTLVIGLAIVRDPRPRTFILGLAASVLVVFTFMTQMHERYAYAALVLLVLYIHQRGVRWIWIAFGIVYALNLLASVPPSPDVGVLLPRTGPVDVAGSVILTGMTLLLVALTVGARSTDGLADNDEP